MASPEKQLIINLAAKMDARTNNEYMEVAPNDVGLQLVNLVNQDLFYTKALTSRQGVVDVCGGVIAASGTPTIRFNMVSGSAGGTQYIKEPVYMQNLFYDREGQVINFGTGTTSLFNINNGTVYLQDCSAVATGTEVGYDLTMQIYIHQIVSTNTTGNTNTSFIDAGGTHNIALSGNFNESYLGPQLANAANAGTFVDPVPVAISYPTLVNFGTNYVSGNGVVNFNQNLPFGSPIVPVPFEFSAPYQFSKQTPYYMSIIMNNTSGTSGRGVQALVMCDGVDDVPQVKYANEFLDLGTPSGTRSNMLRSQEDISIPAGTKGWLQSTVYQYNTPTTIKEEFPAVAFTQSAPLSPTYAPPGSGYGVPNSNLGWQTAPNANPFPGLTQTPTQSTTGTAFGNVFILPSGQYNINGGYFYANTWTGNGYQFFTTNNQILDTTNYQVNYVCNLLQVVGSQPYGSGFVTSQVATFTGNYTFNDPNTYQQNIAPNFTDIASAGVNSNLNKIYGLFNNPVTVNNTGNSTWILSFQFLNPATNQPITDYAVKTINNGTGNLYQFASPISVGFQNKTNFSDNQVYIHLDTDTAYPNGPVWTTYAFGGSDIYLTGGLMSIPSGNAITSIYDYRVGDNSSQRVMFTQGPNLDYFTLNNPTVQTNIYSSGITDPNAKWCHSTFQNLLFSHQYSEVSGICWDQIYSQPTGNWTQLHGLQPSFKAQFGNVSNTPSGSTISGTFYSTGIPSGSQFNVVLATQIESGGLRSSQILQASGNNATGLNALQLLGAPGQSNATYPYDIFHVSGLAGLGIVSSGQSQYNFDINSNGTYVFATQTEVATSGNNNTYFLAPLCDSNGNPYPNPMPNNNTWNSYAPFYSGTNTTPGSGVYIYDVSFQGANAQQVPQIIDFSQNYLTEQVSTPKFKKMLVWNNILWGIGDPNFPSRLWFSQIGSPQIWGGAGSIEYGYYDVDPDDGQYLTGMEVFKNFLILFKQNKTYSANYTFTAGNPLSIQNISPSKGNLSVFSTAATDYGVFGLSQFGPVLATYYGTETIGDEILPYFNELSHDDLIHSVAILDTARQQIYWSITNSSISPDNQIGLVYSYAQKAWGTRQNGMWNAAGLVGDVNDFTLLLIGDTLGQIKQLNSGSFGDDVLYVDTDGNSLTQNVDLAWETPWLNFGDSNNQKQLRSLRINAQEADQILQIQIYINQDTSAPVATRYLDLSQPVNNRKINFGTPFRTIKLLVNTIGAAEMTKINSLQFSFTNWGIISSY